MHLDPSQLDIVLTNQPVPRDAGAAFRSQLVGEQPVSILGHPHHQGDSAFCFPDDLAGVPIILPATTSVMRNSFDLVMECSGIGVLVAAEADDMAMLRLLAREMDALALLPPVVVRDELESGELVELHRIEGLQEAFYAITSVRRAANPYVQQLLEAATTTMQY